MTYIFELNENIEKTIDGLAAITFIAQNYLIADTEFQSLWSVFANGKVQKAKFLLGFKKNFYDCIMKIFQKFYGPLYTDPTLDANPDGKKRSDVLHNFLLGDAVNGENKKKLIFDNFVNDNEANFTVGNSGKINKTVVDQGDYYNFNYHKINGTCRHYIEFNRRNKKFLETQKGFCDWKVRKLWTPREKPVLAEPQNDVTGSREQSPIKPNKSEQEVVDLLNEKSSEKW